MWAVSNELVAANHPLHWSVRLAAVNGHCAVGGKATMRYLHSVV